MRRNITRHAFMKGVTTIAVFAVAGWVAGCGSDTPDPVALTPVSLSISPSDNLQWMNVYVAQGAGLFEHEGIEVTVQESGMADVAVMPMPAFITSVGRGQPVVAFANLMANDPANLVVSRAVVDARGVSPAMPLRDRLDAMTGLRIGVASGPQSRLRALFASIGMNAERRTDVIVVPGPQQNAAFGSSRVDAIFAHTPALETAVGDQGGRVLVNLSAGEVPALANRQIHLLVTSQGYAEDHADVLVAVTRAIYLAQRLIHNDIAATVEAIRASDLILQAPHQLETIVPLYEPAIPPTPDVSVEGVQRELAFFPENRSRPDLSDVDLSRHVDNRYAEQAVAEVDGL